LKLGDDAKIFLVNMMRASWKKIAEYVIRLVKVIPASRVKARCAQPLIIIHRLWKLLRMVGLRRERRMVGKRMMVIIL